MTTDTKTATVTLPASVWLAALDTCKATCADGRDGRDGRANLTAVSVRIVDGRVTFAGADGFALVRVTVDETPAEGNGDYLIGTVDEAYSPFKTAISLLKVAAKDQANIPVTFTDKAAEMIIGATRITIPLLDATYPRYEELIPAIQPDATISHIAMDANLIGGILAIASKYGRKTSRKGTIARFRFTEDRSPARIDWNGNGWHATAAVMPMFVDWTGDADALGDR